MSLFILLYLKIGFYKDCCYKFRKVQKTGNNEAQSLGCVTKACQSSSESWVIFQIDST